VRVCFPNAVMSALFNTHAELERRFGARRADRIAMLLQVLLAARHLGDVPAGPPIRLRIVGGIPAEFTVALGTAKRLRFRATENCSYKNNRIVLESVKVIEVLGVDL